jgi:glycosyltransferase involved in cell wall biosynthesis
MKIKVAIDARWLVGGIGTYTRNLIEGLSQRTDELELNAITGNRFAAAVEAWCPQRTIVNSPIYSIREQWTVPRAVNGSDLLHVPHYNAPLLHRGAMVITIYDLIHITDHAYRRSLKSWAYGRPMLHLAARRANHIITTSQYSKDEIVRHLRIPKSKVTVIYPALSPQFVTQNREEAAKAVGSHLGVWKPFLLYVGNLKPHKNFPLLLNAFARICERGRLSHRLVAVVHGANDNGNLTSELRRLNILDRVDLVSKVETSLLGQVYAAADAVVLPSRLEGFGLPVLEAMACGAPVVCSRGSSLPEVGGEAAEYFNLSDPEDLCETLERVLSDPDRAVGMRARGFERAECFRRNDTISQHIDVYRKVLEP